MYLRVFLFASLVTLSCALFLEEDFVFRGNATRMQRSFNITLVRRATIPASLKLNSLCQTNSYQLEKFNNATNGKYISRTRDVDCPTVKYCDNGGMAGSYGLCPGSKHQLVDSKCTENLWDSTTTLIEKTSQQTLAASKKFAENAVSAAIVGISTAFTQELDGLNSILTSAMTNQEATLVNAISDASASITAATSANIASLAKATSVRMSQLQDATNNQFRSVQAVLNTQQLDRLYSYQSLKENMVTSAVIINNRISSMADYVDIIVNASNVNAFSAQTNLEIIMATVQRLAVRIAKLDRFTVQGVDVSPLLSHWHSANRDDVFQDPTTNKYSYVGVDMLGIYPSESA